MAKTPKAEDIQPKRDKRELTKEVTNRFLRVAGELMFINRRNGSPFKTRASFAASLQMPINGFNNLESQIHQVTVEQVAEMCRVYGVNGHWLLTGVGERYYNSELIGRMEKLEQRLDAMEDRLEITKS